MIHHFKNKISDVRILFPYTTKNNLLIAQRKLCAKISKTKEKKKTWFSLQKESFFKIAEHDFTREFTMHYV